MKSYKYWGFLIVFLIATCLAMSCLAQTVTFSGENYIEISSPKIKKQRIDFNRVYTTDWFVTANDSHCAINFEGPYDTRKLTLAIDWSGKKDEFVITDETNHIPNGDDKKASFLVSVPNKDTYGDGLGAQPEGDQQVIVKVEKITDDNISGNISGLISQGRDIIKVNGHFSLAKKATAKSISKSTSLTFKDCDNAIHDKLTGAQDRSPTECEVKYDLEVKTAFQKAFENVVSGFQNDHWLVTKITPLEPVTGVARASDNSSFLGDYDIELQMDPKNDKYIELNKRYEELAEGYKDSSNNAKMENFQNYEHKMNSVIYIKIYARVNYTYSSMYIFKDGHKMLKAPGASYVIESPYIRSGGGDYIYIGNWKAPVIVKDSDGGETITVMPVIVKSGTNLSVKNIFIRMECNSELAEQILKGIDFSKLTSLLN